MEIKKTKVKTYRTEAFCDCGGALKDGAVRRKDNLIEHTCEKCGKTFYFDGCYPRIVFIEDK